MFRSRGSLPLYFCFYFVNRSKLISDLSSLPMNFPTQYPKSSPPSLPPTSLKFGLKRMTLTKASMGANAWVLNNHHSPSCSSATFVSVLYWGLRPVQVIGLLEGAVKLGLRFWKQSSIPFVGSAIWDLFGNGLFSLNLLCFDTVNYIWAIFSCTFWRQEAAMMAAARDRPCRCCFV